MSRNLAQSTSSVVGALLTDAKTLIRKTSTSADVAAQHVLQRQQLPWDIKPNLGMVRWASFVFIRLHFFLNPNRLFTVDSYSSNESKSIGKKFAFRNVEGLERI